MNNNTIWDTFVTVWNYALWKVDHEGVTVGHCIIAIIVMIVGFKVAQHIKRRLHKRLEHKGNFSAT